MMKIYKAARGPDGCTVTVDGAVLDQRTDLGQYSIDGFEWGYEGSGPQQLALAILANHFADDAQALTKHKVFMEVVIAVLQTDEWTLTSEQIDSSFSQVVHVNMTLETLLNRVRGLE
jgi:hypothetical protein